MTYRYILFNLVLLFLQITTETFAIGERKLEVLDSLLETSVKCSESNRNPIMEVLGTSLVIFQEENNIEGLAKTYLAISNCYIKENQLDTSLSLLLQALKYGDDLNDSTIKSKVFSNLGLIYHGLKSYQTSEKYFHLSALYGDDRAKATAMANIGMVFSAKKQLDSAFYYFENANLLFLSLDDNSDIVISNIAVINMDLGAICIEKGNFDEAKKYFNKSLINCYSINDYNSIILNYLNFGNVFSIEKKYDLAEDMILRAGSIADSVGIVTLKNLSLQALSELYYSKGDYQQAYDFLKKYINIKDSLRGVDIEDRIVNLQTKYELEHQQQQIRILENQKKINIYKTIFIVLLILLIALIIILYLNNRRIKIRERMTDAEYKRNITQKKLEKAKQDIVQFTKLIQENNERIECFEKELTVLNKEDSKVLHKKKEKLRGMKILKDEDWVYYKNLFRELDAVFYDKMISISNLTEGDKRQILLLKLGYTNKMSADVLGISTEGIKRARQRLAKKLDLKDASKLEDYFLNL